MSPVIFHSFWTVLLLILFVGIILWAFSSRSKKRFDEAARLPLEDEDIHLLPPSQSEEKRAQRATARLPLPLGRGNEGEGGGRGQGGRGEPLIPTPSPSRGEGALTPTPLPPAGEGSSVRSEPSARRAASNTRGEKKHG